jgi:hypothetical protein
MPLVGGVTHSASNWRVDRQLPGVVSSLAASDLHRSPLPSTSTDMLGLVLPIWQSRGLLLVFREPARDRVTDKSKAGGGGGAAQGLGDYSGCVSARLGAPRSSRIAFAVSVPPSLCSLASNPASGGVVKRKRNSGCGDTGTATTRLDRCHTGDGPGCRAAKATMAVVERRECSPLQTPYLAATGERDQTRCGIMQTRAKKSDV